jgi:membrane protein
MTSGGKSLFRRTLARWDQGWANARARVPAFDHVCRAHQRYGEQNGGRLAAAAAYYGFFAVLAMAVVCFVILGLVFQDNPRVVEVVTRYLRENLPQVQMSQLIDSSRQIGVIAVIGLVVAGVAWVENLRGSQRALWLLEQQPGNPVVRWMVDLAVLLGLGVLLLVSVAVFAGIQDTLPRLASDDQQTPVRLVVRGSGVVQSGLVDVLLGAALLAGIPRLRMSPRRLLSSAALFAIGFGLLKTIGRWYLTNVTHNPAYQAFAGTVGLLAFMYLLHRVLLFAAALAATSTRGAVVDFAHRPKNRKPVPGT